MSPGTDPATGLSSDGGGDESHSERVNRELIELLNELRVALPGVQVLFAFLLAVPFAQGFTTTTDFQRDLYFGTLLATAVSSALLIAPSAYHRINFRERDKERMLLTSNALTIVGLIFLAMAIVGAVVLIADYVYGPAVPIVSAILGAAIFATLWFVVPIVRRNPQDRPDRG
ncbi:MAG TPA: DUF6328 family protein [Tepidiformaceae bacterium]|nr:DUF6328 family protein [Tepidiformaceae bacterium]